MSCLLIPAAEAAVTTIAAHILEKRAEKRGEKPKDSLTLQNSEPFYKKLKVLSTLLWGGSALLAFDHVWNGEALIPTTAEALKEMATLGTSMATFLTAAWALILAAKSLAAKKKALRATTVSENS